MYEVHTSVYTVQVFVCTTMCVPTVGIFCYHSLPYCFEEELLAEWQGHPVG